MSVHHLPFDDQEDVFDAGRRSRRASNEGPSSNLSAGRERPDMGLLVDAISHASSTIVAKDRRIDELEQQQREFEDLARRLKSKLGEMARDQQAADARTRNEAERADRAEAENTLLHARIRDLESELDRAIADLNKVAEVITRSLISER